MFRRRPDRDIGTLTHGDPYPESHYLKEDDSTGPGFGKPGSVHSRPFRDTGVEGGKSLWEPGSFNAAFKTSAGAALGWKDFTRESLPLPSVVNRLVYILDRPGGPELWARYLCGCLKIGIGQGNAYLPCATHDPAIKGLITSVNTTPPTQTPPTPSDSRLVDAQEVIERLLKHIDIFVDGYCRWCGVSPPDASIKDWDHAPHCFWLKVARARRHDP